MTRLKLFSGLLLFLFLSLPLLGVTTVLSENFAGLTVSGGSADISTTLDTKLQTTGWTGSKIYENAGEAKLGSSSGLGYIVTKTVDLSAQSGAATLTFEIRQYGTDTGKYIQVYHASNGTTFTQVGSDIAIPTGTSNTLITVNITGGAATSKIKIAAKLAANNRFYLDNLAITQIGGASVPTLTTTAISSITETTATGGGAITDDGGSTVSARGVCWNTTGTPVATESHTSDGTGTGSFTSSLTSLAAGTTYFVRAYATNTTGTGYGTAVTFSTSGGTAPSAPTATTATSITSSSFTATWGAVSGATSYQLDVSTSNAFSSFLSGYNSLSVTGVSQLVSGLSASSTYYYRVRAVNTNGTSTSSNTITVVTSATDPFNGYYNSVSGLSGTALKTGLHTLIATNTYSSYDGAKLFMFQTADNQSGVVRCVYTGKDYTISSSYDGASDPNTEHTFAQSWFGTSEATVKKADVHHLFPTNSTVNSTRGNYPFDVVTNVTNTFASYNGYVSKKGTNSSGAIVFEPADQHKGDLARALLYFSVRYSMSLSQGGVDMLPTLLVWNTADPVDARELARNASIYTLLGNRNPFVDHPEYVASIWGGSTANTTIQFSPASADINENGGSVTLTVTITNPSTTTATTAQIQLTDGSATDVGNYTTHTITFPANSSTSQTITVNVTDDALLEGDETLVFSLVNVSGGTSASIGNYGTYNLTIQDNDIPSVTPLAATSLSSSGFTANWQAASGITTYEFDLSTSSDFSTFVTGYEALQVTGTTVAVTGLNQSTNYYYRVRALYNETSGANSTSITVTTNPAIPAAPVATTATGVTTTGFTATWSAASYATDYRLDVSTGNTFTTYVTGYQDVTVSGLSQAVTGLTAGTTYYYRVRAVNIAGTSDASNIITVQTNSESSGTVILSTGFEGSTSFPSGWLQNSSYVQNTAANAHAGTYYAGENSAADWIRTPVLASPTTLTFWAKGSSSTAAWTVIVQTSPDSVTWTDKTSFAANGSDTGDITATYAQKSVSLSLTGNYYLRWYMPARTSGSFYLDDVEVTSGTVAPTVPAAPVTSAATSITGTGFTANWGVVSTATSYRLDVSTSLTFASYVTGYQDLTVSGNSQAVTGLTSGSTYYYRVRGVNAVGTGANSDTMTVQTLSAPSVPVAVTATGVSTTGFTATWEAAANAESYRLDVSTSDQFTSYVTGYQDLTVSSTSQSVTGLTAATTYFYRVRAVNTIGTSTNSNTITVTTNTESSGTVILTTGFEGTTNAPSGWLRSTTGSYILNNVANAHGGTNYAGTNAVSGWVRTAVMLNPTTMTFWGRASSATSSFTVDVQTSPDSTTWTNAVSFAANGGNTGDLLATYAQKTVNLNLTGSYYVRWNMSARTSGSFYFDDVEVTSGTPTPTVPAAPVATAATDLTTSGFTATWNASASADSYRLDVSTGNTFTSYVSGYQDLSGSGLTQAVTGLSAGSTYYYRVRAVNTVGASDNSNIITAVTTAAPTVPVAPVAGAASDISTTGFTANWSASATAESYRLDVSTGNGFTSYVSGYQDLTVAGLTQAVTGLSAGTTYYYRVRAVNTVGTSSNSEVITVTTNSIVTGNELFFSEYIEGSSNNKAIEIYNSTTSAVDLSQYTVKQAFNGGAWSTTVFALTGTLSPDSVFVLANSSANATILAQADLTSANLNFNGNDAIGLFKNGTLIDIIGIQGNDPTTGWTVAGTTAATKDHTLVRKSTTTHGNTDWTVSAGTTIDDSEWIINNIDVFTFLGSHEGPSAGLASPVVTMVMDGDNLILSWTTIATAGTYRVEASSSPYGTFTDVTTDGVFDAVDTVTSWKGSLTDNLKFYRVISVSAK